MKLKIIKKKKAIVKFTGLLIFGINGFSKEWMPNSDDNYYSWAYWSQMSASFFSLISGNYLKFKSYYCIKLSINLILKDHFCFLSSDLCFTNSEK